MNKLLTLEHITAAYDTKVVLRDVGLTVWENDFLGIIGPNGGGKTTLLKVILRLLKPVAGTVAFYRDGQPVASLNIGYLPQINKIDKRFPISVREVIASGLMAQTRGARHLSKQQQQRVAEVIVWMGLDALSRRAIGELSGGQRQRVLVARALAIRPAVLLLDEPFTGLDMPTQEMLMDLFRALADGGRALLMTTHDLIGARAGCDRLYLLRRTIVGSGRPEELADADPWIRAFDVRPDNPILDALGVRA